MKKKNVSKLLAATVAASAIVAPAGALAAETNPTTSSIAEGVYFADHGKFYTIGQLSNLSKPEVVNLLENNAKVFIYLKGIGTANLTQVTTNKGSFIAAAKANGSIDNPEKIIPGGTYEGLDSSIFIPGTKGAIAEVSAVDSKTIEVTFNNRLETLPAASEFKITGETSSPQVTGTKFKSGSNNQVVELTVLNQQFEKYTLEYNSAKKTFIGIHDLPSVLLEASAYEVEIIPSQNKLTPVTITATLSQQFAELKQKDGDNIAVTMEFATSFGTVVKTAVTQDNKLTFQLTPNETVKDEVAIVSGKVIDVKNTKTGKSYPEFNNARVGTINVKFIVKDPEPPTPITYNISTALATQADRVLLRVNEGFKSGKLSEALNFATEDLIATSSSETQKEMYRHLHDVLFSKINKTVKDTVGNKTALTNDDVDAVKTALKDTFKVSGKDLTAADLKNILLADTIGKTGSRFASVYAPLIGGGSEYDNKTKLVEEVNQINFEGVLSYYKLLSKFVVLDNVKDSASPKAPDQILPVEYIYKQDATDANNKTLVLVLPTERSNSDLDIKDGINQEQTRDHGAKYLQDNVSHQVVFVNDSKDGFEIKGDPSFKLEDATALFLKDVQNSKYYKQDTTTITVGDKTNTNFCAIPFSVDVESNDYNPGGNDDNTTQIPPSYTGTPKLTADTFNIREAYYFNNQAGNLIAGPNFVKDNKVADKLGELRVVFSEAVALENGKSPADVKDRTVDILNPSQWTIDGINLAKFLKDNGLEAHFQLVSTNPQEKLRDAVSITFTSTVKNGQLDNTLVQKFLEKNKHKLQVNKVGDWAAITDVQNMLPTDSLDFDGFKDEDAKKWGNDLVTEVPGHSKDELTALIPKKEAEVLRAAGQADVTTGIAVETVDNKDIIRILFSEPMQITGANSALNKANYRLDGKALPENGTSLKIGLAGVEGMEQSQCAVTIELPNGALQDKDNNHTLSIQNVKGVDDNEGISKDRIQLAYARNFTAVLNKPTEGITKYTEFTGKVTSSFASNINAVLKGIELREYLLNGKAVTITDEMAKNEEFFTQHYPFSVANPGNTAPTIALADGVPSTINYTIGDAQPTFSEADVKVADADGDTTTVTVDSSAVKFDTAGTYKVTYKVTDGKGGQATLIRNVVVNAKEVGKDVTVGSSIAEVTQVIPGYYNVKVTIAQLTAAGFKDVTKTSNFTIAGTPSQYIEAEGKFLFPAVSAANEAAAKALIITQN